jgi:hypothetical protein
MAVALTSSSSDRKGALSFRVVIAVFFGLMLAGLLLGLVIHRRYVGFERVVAHHVPPDAALVLRWDVEKVSLFEPTRRFLLPLIDAHPAAGPAVSEPEGARRRDRVAERTGLQLGRDLREALVSFGPAPNDWALVLGGSFPEGDVLSQALPALERDGLRVVAPGRLQTLGGLSLARAIDGAFVLAASPARLDAGLVSRPLQPTTPRTGAGSLVIHPDRQGLPESVREVLSGLGDVSQVLANAEWGSPLSLELEVRFRHTPPADAGERLKRALGSVFLDQLPRLEQKFGPLHVESAENHGVRVRMLLDDIVLEQLARRLSLSLADALALRPAHN